MKRWMVLSLMVLSAPAFAQSVPVIRYESIPNAVRLPQNMYLGEAAGVAVNSKKHVFVFSRGNTTGPAFGASARRSTSIAIPVLVSTDHGNASRATSSPRRASRSALARNALAALSNASAVSSGVSPLNSPALTWRPPSASATASISARAGEIPPFWP